MAFSTGRFGFTQTSVDGVWSWSVVVQNMTYVGQYFYVSDITTPFGTIDVVDSPIPSDVIIAMHESLSAVSDQLVPSITLSSAPIVSTAVEGDQTSIIGSVVITNSGALGSMLSVSASVSVPWLSTTPVLVTGVGVGQTASFSVVADPSDLIPANSPYSGVITIQDVSRPLSHVDVNVTLNVLPAPIISALPASIELTYDLSDCSPGPDVVLTVENSGPALSIMSFSIAKVLDRSPWLSISPISGGPIDSGDSLPVTMSVIEHLVPQTVGIYSDTLVITSQTATNSPFYVPVTLTVST